MRGTGLAHPDFDAELAAERAHVAALHRKVDAERDATSRQLDAALRDTAATGPESRWQRQVDVDRHTRRLRALRTAERGLCFGRIDDEDGNCAHIGRIGLFDEANDFAPMLVDWRSPAARPFYCATAPNPEGLVRRRHFTTSGRDITAFHDDVFHPSADPDEQGGDAALLAALNAPRHGAMRDIVATIQAEQDEIIREQHGGVLVLEGGPGTGKTAVALHRVAYLLYTHPDELARRGVLVLGPNQGFLQHIGNVLPSLGETSVVFATTGELFPGVRATGAESPRAERIKGDPIMLDVLAAAVADRQELPAEPIPVELRDMTVHVDADIAAAARAPARATGLRHNDARSVFRDWLVDGLIRSAVDQVGAGWLDADDSVLRAELAAETRAELVSHPDVDAAVEQLWPLLSPQRLLAELFSSPGRIAAAAGALDEQDRDCLHRELGDAWTVSDVPLLDESVDLLGANRAEQHRAQQLHDERVSYAQGVLDVLDTDGDGDPGSDGEVLRAVDLIDAEALAERHAECDHRDLAQRAIEDRDWTYGHVVVDEAQELSAMDWRSVVRRCPVKSMTVVGDLAQRRSPAGARSWPAALDPHVPGRWGYRALTVNYRTPADIMAVATDVLAEVDPSLTPPDSVRSTGVAPQARRVSAADLPRETSEVVRELSATGSVAVIAPEEVEIAVDAAVRSPSGAKGLEFDAVVVVRPERILTTGPRGAADLYVALTRATQRLVVLHTDPLPAALARLAAPDPLG